MTEDKQIPENGKNIVGIAGKQWPDQEWVTCMSRIAHEKDREAFRQLFDHFAPRLKSYAISHSDFGKPEMAEEIVQETMVKVWQKADLFHREKAAVSTWIFTIARNCRVDLLRRQQNMSPMLDADDIHIEDESDFSDPTRLVSIARSGDIVRDALKKLPEDQALIVSKVYLEGKSHTEISEELSLPLGTVKSRLRLAMEKLKSYLDAERT